METTKDGYLRIGISPTQGKWCVSFEGNMQPIIGDSLENALMKLIEENKQEVVDYLKRLQILRTDEDMSNYKINGRGTE